MSSDFLDGIAARSAAFPVAPRARTVEQSPSGPSFSDVLKEAQSAPLRISAHASSRLQERGVQLSSDDLTQIGQAVQQAAQKGSRDTFVLYGETGLVVNVPNRTVVTAMQSHPGTVVTNIDSVVIVPRLDRTGG